MEETADKLKAFVVGDMRRGFLRKRPTIEVMREVCLNNRRCNCGAHRNGVDRHRDSGSGVRSYRRSLVDAPNSCRVGTYGVLGILAPPETTKRVLTKENVQTRRVIREAS